MDKRKILASEPTSGIDVSQRYLVVISTFLTSVAIGLLISSFGVFFKPLSTEFGWTRAETSGASSLAFIISGIMGILTGRLADRFNPRIIIVSCGVIGGCACLLMSSLNSLWQLYFYYGILVGFAMSAVIPATTLITRNYKKRRGLMTGITIGGGSLSSVASAPVLTRLIASYDWRFSYIAMGVAILLIVGVSAFFLWSPSRRDRAIEAPSPSAPRAVSERKGPGLTAAIRSRTFWILGCLFFCAGFTQQAVLVHLIPHATDIGIAAIVAALIYSVAHGACTVGQFGVGRINDTIGSRSSMILCLVTQFLSLIVLLLAGNVGLFYAFAILFGLSWGGTATLRSTLVADLFGMSSHGAITGAILFVATIGGALSPLLAGYIFDITGGYRIAFIILTVVCLLGSIMAITLKYRTVSLPANERS